MDSVTRSSNSAWQGRMLKYHQFRGRLGMGDLHPGGAPATAEILRLLREEQVERVLEVGAGIGNTAVRMLDLGWDVTALEPDPVLFETLRKRLGARARHESLLEHATALPYDAIIAESVFCMLDLPRAFAQARALLKPGGHLAFVEAVWTDGVSAAQSKAWHEQTLELFGIPVGSRERLTWADWRRSLGECGFETQCAERLAPGSSGHPPTPSPAASIAAVLRDPRLVLWMARYRARKRTARMPAGVLESWIYLGRTATPVRDD
jgi:SAM-dependent methyltransferase